MHQGIRVSKLLLDIDEHCKIKVILYIFQRFTLLIYDSNFLNSYTTLLPINI